MTENDFSVFITKDIHYANSLRRTIISDVPTLAIDNVNIEFNGSNLHDEIIAHRLSMIPLDSTDLSDKEITLDLLCSDDYLDVTSSDLVSDIKIMGDIMVVRLHKGERLKLTAIAKQGTARDHAKWCAISGLRYDTRCLDEKTMEARMIVESAGNLPSKDIIEKAKLLIGKHEREYLNKFKQGYDQISIEEIQ